MIKTSENYPFGITFDDIAKEHEVLNELEEICTLLKSRSDGRLNHIWYSIIKPAMSREVGFDSNDDRFRNTEAYEIVYNHLCKKLGVM